MALGQRQVSTAPLWWLRDVRLFILYSRVCHSNRRPRLDHNNTSSSRASLDGFQPSAGRGSQHRDFGLFCYCTDHLYT